MKIMAIDYGDARTGIAVSDPTGLIAGFTCVVHGHSPEKVADQVAELVQTQRAEELVLGFPRNMDGTEGARAELYRSFAALLEQRTGLTPVLWDERRTTIEAHAILSGSGRRMKEHRKNVDAVAATLILDGYLIRKRQPLSP